MSIVVDCKVFVQSTLKFVLGRGEAARFARSLRLAAT